MAPSRGKKTRSYSLSNLAEHVWHFEGEKTYEDCDKGTGFFGGAFRTKDRFSHYISAGGLQHDARSRSKKREREPVEQRPRIIRWLVCFGLLWILFYFLQA